MGSTNPRKSEAAARYRLTLGGGITTFRAAANVTHTRVDRFTAGGPLDSAKEIRDYEAGLPKRRLLLSVEHSRGPFDLSARYSFFGGWYDSEEDLDFDGDACATAGATHRTSAQIRPVRTAPGSPR